MRLRGLVERERAQDLALERVRVLELVDQQLRELAADAPAQLGVAQLLTCGGLGIWSLVDGIILLTSSNTTDSNGRVLRG